MTRSRIYTIDSITLTLLVGKLVERGRRGRAGEGGW